MKKIISNFLLSIIFIQCSLIYINYNQTNKEFYQKNILEKNINLSKYKTFYQKYITNYFNKEEQQNEEQLVFKENENVEKINNSYMIKTDSNIVETKKSGIIVFIGEKEDLGNTIIIQGNDGADIWYSNVDDINYTLYDYVNKNTPIATCKDYYYLTINKENQYLDYEEYFSDRL